MQRLPPKHVSRSHPTQHYTEYRSHFGSRYSIRPMRLRRPFFGPTFESSSWRCVFRDVTKASTTLSTVAILAQGTLSGPCDFAGPFWPTFERGYVRHSLFSQSGCKLVVSKPQRHRGKHCGIPFARCPCAVSTWLQSGKGRQRFVSEAVIACQFVYFVEKESKSLKKLLLDFEANLLTSYA